MFCSDDKHPDSLVEGHINQLCARSVAKGIDIFKVLKAACVNPVGHYKLKVGLLRENDFADFVLVKDLKNFEVVRTYINGQSVAENGKTLIESQRATTVNNFNCSKKQPEDFKINTPNVSLAIEALDGQLITNKISLNSSLNETDIENDILKIVVVDRYKDAPVAKTFIKNFGLKTGAIASSVAHDSHDIVAVGVDDESICKAVNLVINKSGGVSAVSDQQEMVLALPIAGLMSNDDGYKVAAAYTAIDKMVKEELGSRLAAPFMTLSFMALLVIPHLKLSDLGLFDGDGFEFV
jgi:adenine deaminase